jgi:HEPN domain-containing protein
MFDFKVPVEKSDMEFLSSIYIESCYPHDLGLLPKGEPGKNDAERAMKIARQICDYFINNY